MEIKITLEQLECLLHEQKRLVIETLLHHTYCYNKESTESNLIDIPINKEKFNEIGMCASFPKDLLVLKKYTIL